MSWYISHATTGDASRFAEMAQRGRTELWTVNPNARQGDRVLIYVKGPVSAFMATATVTGSRWHDGARYGWPNFKMIAVRIDKAIEPPVHIQTIRQALPDWGWAKMPMAQARVPEDIAPRLLRLLQEGPNATDAVEVERSGRVVGGGFGTPEENRKVEQAAIQFVRARYSAQGWVVKDRQREKCGYDLQAKRGVAERHLEVKGTRGPDAGFIITAGELKCSRTDPAFRLCVVTNALTTARKMTEYRGKQLVKDFELKPIAYIAREKMDR